MSYAWNRVYHDVGFVTEPGIVRVSCDQMLRKYLSEGKRKAALDLAEHAINAHEKEQGRPLDISRKSLACEIYDHYRLMRMTEALSKVFGENFRPLKWMKRHMIVIDCGEKKLDNNRFLWDMFSIFW